MVTGASWGCSPRVSSSSFLQRSPSRNVHLLLKQKSPIYIHYSLRCNNRTKKFPDQNNRNLESMCRYPVNYGANNEMCRRRSNLRGRRKKRSRSAFKSSRRSRGREKKVHSLSRTGRETEEDSADANVDCVDVERTRYCDWEPAVSPHFQIRRTRRIYAPSLATIPLRKKPRDGFSRRPRPRPPTSASTPHSRDACSWTGLELLACGTRNRCTRHTWSRGDHLRWRKGVTIRPI